MIEEHWFSTPIWFIDNFFSSEEFFLLKEFCNQIKDKDVEGRMVSNQGGWQSNFLYDYDFIAANCYFYKQKIIEKSILILENLACGLNYKDNLKISSWININKKDNYNTLHCHPACELSCVYYLTDGSDITFKRSNGEMSYYLDNVIATKCTTKLSASCVNFKPRPNLIVFFPSFLAHEVHSSKSSCDRISISSNIVITK